MKIKTNWNQKKKWLTELFLIGLLSLLCVFPAIADEEQLAAPESAGWSRTVKTTATWKKVEKATGYQLRLYLDDEYIKTVQVEKAKADLSEYMKKEGCYYYDVRAIATKKNGVKYRKSSEYTLSDEQILENLGDTDGSWKNYVEGKKYRKSDRSYVENGWYRILGEWYYFDENGYMVTGWKQLGSTWYYMDQDGKMQTGWLKEGEQTYYLNSDGSMAIGWLQTGPGEWHYFLEDGAMASSTSVDGYSINASGVWIPN